MIFYQITKVLGTSRENEAMDSPSKRKTAIIFQAKLLFKSRDNEAYEMHCVTGSSTVLLNSE